MGYVSIKDKRQTKHRNWMLKALSCSALFLALYLVYHYQVGSVKYPYPGISKVIYLIILIPHIILAGAMVPFILLLLWYAFKDRLAQHKKFARVIFPIWMYVSITGIVIYLMLYVQPYFNPPPKIEDSEQIEMIETEVEIEQPNQP